MASAFSAETPRIAHAQGSSSPLSGPRPARWRPNLMDGCYAREMLLPMTLGLIVLMLALAGNFVYWAINSVVNQGMPISPVVRLFLLASPGFAIQGVPAGVILAVCLVLNRAVRDNEVIALRAGGASLTRIVAPFLVMAALASVADWFIVEKVAPITNDLAEKSLARIMLRPSVALIESDKYFRVGQFYFYVGSVQGHGPGAILQNVMIYERDSSRYSSLVPATFPIVRLAALGQEDPVGSGKWRFDHVIQHVYNPDGTQLSEASVDRVYIDVGQDIQTYWAEQKQPFSMTSDELSREIKDLSNAAFDAGQLNALRVDYYRRFALPAACLVMALVAAPLSLRFARHGSFAGLVSAFLLAFLWQGFDGWFRALGIAGRMPPLAAAWTTNALFVFAGCLLLALER